jgi:hypothetical protein
MKLRSLNHDHWAIEILQSKFKNYLALPIKIGRIKPTVTDKRVDEITGLFSISSTIIAL